MSRMRTLKPEFWEDEGVGLLSRDARLLYMATWNAADDEGILRWNAAYLKSQAFIYDDDLSTGDIDNLMAELVESRMIFPYKGGKSKQPLALIVKFQKHQRPNRPQPSKMPAPSLQNPQVAAMYAERDEWTCHICLGPIPHGPQSGKDTTRWLSLDHVNPRSKGGSDYPSNIKAAHSGCNSGKKDRVLPDMNAVDTDAPYGDEPFTESFSESDTAVVVVVEEGSGVVEEGGVVARAERAPTAADIIARWIEQHDERPPKRIVGQVAQQVGEMLHEGIAPDTVIRGLVAWTSKGLAPSALPSFVHEAQKRPAGARSRQQDETDALFERAATRLGVVK